MAAAEVLTQKIPATSQDFLPRADAKAAASDPAERIRIGSQQQGMKMMMELMTRKKRTQLMLIFACAFGCTCASISGTLAALNLGTDLHLTMPDQRPS